MEEKRKQELIQEYSRVHEPCELFTPDTPDSLDCRELAKLIGEELWDVL